MCLLSASEVGNLNLIGSHAGTVESCLAPGALREGDLALEFRDLATHPVHRVPAYFFRMIGADSGEELGIINLRHASTPHIKRYAGHVGYAVHPPHRGHRYAARSVRLLLSLARELRLDPLWITTDPGNAASRRSCELAGAKFIEIVDVPLDCIIHRNGHPRKCRFRLHMAQ
jgi:tagatose 1,6-diphosphate aldolase